MTHTCLIRRCGGTLVVERTLTQDGTGEKAFVTRCDRNRAHRYFLVGDRGPSLFNRLNDDTRWEKK